MSAAIEAIYFSLAEGYDAVPREKRELFLAKLVLLLAKEIGEPDRFKDAIAISQKNLTAPLGD